MPDNTLRIMGINPGSKYLGIAAFNGSDLKYWGIKTLKGKWSKEKIKKAREIISGLFSRYDIGVMAIKKLNKSRSSPDLNKLVATIKLFSEGKGLRVCEYSIKDLEKFFSAERKINKKRLAELVASQYPFLLHLLENERRNKNPYSIRMFEAIALGIRCFHQLDEN